MSEKTIIDKIMLRLSREMPLGFSKNAVFALLILTGLLILLIPAAIFEKSARDRVSLSLARYDELVILSSEYSSLHRRISAVEKRTSLTKVAGVADAVNTVFTGLGIKAKLKSVKSVATRHVKGSLIEERADVTAEGLSMNELVNLFAGIRDAPMMLSVKKVNMKKSFQTPELLDVTFTISFFSGP